VTWRELVTTTVEVNLGASETEMTAVGAVKVAVTTEHD
jgi:hypothetical protein